MLRDILHSYQKLNLVQYCEPVIPELFIQQYDLVTTANALDLCRRCCIPVVLLFSSSFLSDDKRYVTTGSSSERDAESFFRQSSI